MTRIEKLKQLCEGATKGPWVLSRFTKTLVEDGLGRSVATTGGYQTNVIDPDELLRQNESNAAFVSQSRNELPELLKLIEQMKAAVKGSTRLIGDKVISNVMPNEQRANYDALAAYETWNKGNKGDEL